ncbi:hypothetical protein OJAV_G00116400 [Oryzias javanicus]|uniref:Uncharacterized protein n=1 Tax=Oryzias javanicus TaxID=123683 RepID=A0A437CRC4_ORYJA|nr:hypothetical protein OJAV_G00116400 [Oryzias javanicus]
MIELTVEKLQKTKRKLQDRKQSVRQMELRKVALVIILLSAACAKPHHLYHDADIPDRDHSSELMARVHKLHLQHMSEGSKSSESLSSEESSEETEDTTEEPTDPLVMTTAPMTTLTSGDGDTLPPEPGMNSTEPTMMPELETISLFVNDTTPCTSCFTEEIPTVAPVTDRGDI